MSQLDVMYAAQPGPPTTTIRSPPPDSPLRDSTVVTTPSPRALRPTDFPLLSADQAHTLATQGFVPFPIADRPALHAAATALFIASRTFFAQPPADKSHWRVPAANTQGSEEGWTRIPGEKELLTLRRAGPALCPSELEAPVRVLWAESAALLHTVARAVAQSLALPPGALDGVVCPECAFPSAGARRLETLLRLFRYERPASSKGRLVAEPHRDLGLLSLVIGASPGLEVFDGDRDAWLPIEAPPYASGAGPLTATILVGETLVQLTNTRYTAGQHRVFVLPTATADAEDPRFRHSLVFALRPHAAALIDTDALTTRITGPFAFPLRRVRACDLFAAIARTHWNVNARVETREAEKMHLRDGGAPARDEEKE